MYIPNLHIYFQGHPYCEQTHNNHALHKDDSKLDVWVQMSVWIQQVWLNIYGTVTLYASLQRKQACYMHVNLKELELETDLQHKASLNQQ